MIVEDSWCTLPSCNNVTYSPENSTSAAQYQDSSVYRDLVGLAKNGTSIGTEFLISNYSLQYWGSGALGLAPSP